MKKTTNQTLTNPLPVPEHEEERIKQLEFFDLLHLGKDPDLDVFAETACLVADCPASLIAMMERETQTIQSCVGLSFDFVDRKDTVCQYAIASGEMLVINDTLLDYRSSNNPLIHAAGIRFYAGVPLLDDKGLALGTLCVIDYKPRTLSDHQVVSLKKIGKAITTMLMMKKKNLQAEYFEQTFSVTNNLICVLDNELNIKSVNTAFELAVGVKQEDLRHRNFLESLRDPDPKLKILTEHLKISNEGLEIITTTGTNSSGKVVIEWFLKHNQSQTEIFCFGKNVTHLIEEKQKLEISERRFRNFFENAIGLMSTHDLEGKILSVNKKGREVLKYTEEETRTLNLRDLVPKQNLPLLEQYLQQISINKEDVGTMVLTTKDGEEVFWMYHNMVDTDEEGKPYVVSTALNVTEKFAMEKDLLYTKKILEQTSAAAQVGGWEVNLKKNSVFWSKSARDILKVDSAFKPDLENAFGFYKKESETRVRFLFERAVNEQIPFDEEFQLVQHGGNTLWVRVIGIPEMENGKCTKVFGIIQNVDVFKKIYLELSRKEAMLESFVSYVPAAVAMFDQDLRYLAVSRAWLAEFSMADRGIIGKNLFEVSSHIPRQRINIYMDALKGKSYRNENLAVQVTNKVELQHYKLEISPWYLSEGVVGGVTVSTVNITDTVKANVDLKNAKDMADLASKAKSEFLANMSHEIRTPLNGVIGFSDLLLKTPLNEMQTQYLNYINESGESLLNIINDILDFSKIEAGKMELIIDRTNIYDMVSQVLNVILYQSQKKELELLLNIEQGLPRNILLDEPRIKQVLINLLGNAVKFTGQGEIELKVQKLRMTAEHITLRFAVRDTGIGIPLEKQQRIFDAFTQEDSSVSKKYGGTGLGLTISNNILKYMGSSLTLSSQPEQGSVFYFDLTLPYEVGDASEEGDIEDLNIGRVLIVDDNENNRMILQHMLEYKNIESKLAANGMEALQILTAGERFDVILMDYHMPVISGLQTIDKIKELFEQQDELSPLVVLHTSSEEHEVINSFRQNEKSYCLLKPIKSDELYNTLRLAVKNIKKKHVEEINLLPREEAGFAQFQNVLLVDDNPVNMVLNSKMMQSIAPEARLTEALDGLQALEHCRKERFDLILMDVQMPVMDGIEATKQIRTLSEYGGVKIIGVTAGNVSGEKEKCLQAGMDDFLPKPLRRADLQGMLEKHQDAKNSQEALRNPEQYLDMDHLNEQVGDDEEFNSMFLNLVVKELEASRINLNAAAEGRDFEGIKKILHKLKGTAGTAGLFSLAETAGNWENQIEINPEDSAMNEEISTGITIGLDLIKKLIN